MPSGGNGERYSVSLLFDPSGVQQGTATAGAAFAQMAQVGVQSNQLILQSIQAVSAGYTAQAGAIQALASSSSSAAGGEAALASTFGAQTAASTQLSTGLGALAAVQVDVAAGSVDLSAAMEAAAASSTSSAASRLEVVGASEALVEIQTAVVSSTGEVLAIGEELVSVEVQMLAAVDELAVGNEALAEASTTSAAALETMEAGVATTTSTTATFIPVVEAATSSLAAYAEVVTIVAAGLREIAGVTAGAAEGVSVFAVGSEDLVASNEAVAASATVVVTVTEEVASSSASAAASMEARASASAAVVASQESLAGSSTAVAESQETVVASLDAVATGSERAGAGVAALSTIQEEAAAVQQALGESEAEATAMMNEAAAGAERLAAATAAEVEAQRAASAAATEAAAADAASAATKDAAAASTAAATAATAANTEASTAQAASTSSLQAKLASLVNQVDAKAAAEAKLTAAEKLLNQAVQAGLISLERQNELLDLSKEKFAVAAEAAEAEGVKLGEMTEMVKGLLEVLAVFEAIDFFKESVSSAQNYQVALAQVNASLASTASASGITSSQLVEISEHLEDTTNYSHTAALGMENLLLNFRAVNSTNLDRVTADVADLAAKMGTDLTGAATQLGRVIDTGTVTSLQRIGITFTAAEKTSIQSMVQMGDQAGVLAAVLGRVEAAVGGQAAAVRAAGTGMQALGNTIEAVQEIIGTAMTPAVRAVAAELQEWLKGNEAAAASLGEDLGNAVKVAGDGLLFLADHFQELKVAAVAFASYKTASVVLDLASACYKAIPALIAFDAAADANPFGLFAGAIALVVGAIGGLAFAAHQGAEAENTLADAMAKRENQLPGEVGLLTTLQAQTQKLTEAQAQLLKGYNKITQEAATANVAMQDKLLEKIHQLEDASAASADGIEGYSTLGSGNQQQIDALTKQLQDLRSEAIGLNNTLDAERGFLDGVGESAGKNTPPIAGLTKAQQSLTDSLTKVLVAMQDKAAATSMEADAALQGSNASKIYAASIAAQAQIDKLLSTYKGELTSQQFLLIAATLEAANAVDEETQRKALNNAIFAAGEAAKAEAVASEAKIADAINQTTSASLVSAAVEKQKQDLIKNGVNLNTDSAQGLLRQAAATAQAGLATQATVASIKSYIQYVTDDRTAVASLNDTISQGTSYSTSLSNQLKAEAAARLETGQAAGPEYQAQVRLNLARTQAIQEINFLVAAQKELNTTFDAGNKIAAATADMVQLTQATSTYGDGVAKLLQQYGLLDTASHELQLQEQIRAAQATAQNDTERQLIASQLTLQDQYLQGLKAQQAVVAANIVVQKDWAAAVTSTDQEFQTQFNNLIETGKISWSTFAKDLEDIWLKALEQMAVDGRAANLVSDLTGGTISAGKSAQTALQTQQTAIQTAAQHLTLAADKLQQGIDSQVQQFTAAAVQLRQAGVTLTNAGVSLGGTAPVIQQASVSGADSIVTSGSTFLGFTAEGASTFTNAGVAGANLTTATMTDVSGLLGTNAGEFNVNAQNFSTVANQWSSVGSQLSSVLTALAGSNSGGGFGGLLGGIANLFGGGGSPVAAGTTGVADDSILDVASAGGDTTALTAGASAAGLIGAAAVIGAMFVINHQAEIAQSHGFEPEGDIALTSGSYPGGYNLPGAANSFVSDWNSQGAQFTSAIQSYFEKIEGVTNSLLTQLPDLGIQIENNGKNFAVMVNGKLLGFFQDITSATNAAIDAGLKQASWSGMSKLVQDYIKQAANAALDPSVIETNVETLTGIEQSAAAALAGAGAQVQASMQSLIQSAEQAYQAVQTMNLSAADLATAFGDIGDTLIAGIDQQRDAITGTKESIQQQKQETADAFDAQLAIAKAQVASWIYQVEAEEAAAQASATYGQGLADNARSISENTYQIAKATAIATGNSSGLAQALANLQEIQNELNNIKPVTAGEVVLSSSSSSASTAASTISTAAQALTTALQGLAQFGMDSFETSLAQLKDQEEQNVISANGNTKAIADYTKALAAQEQLLKEQTLAGIGTDITPYIQESHGITGYNQQLATLDTTFAGYLTTAKEAGAGAALYNRILAAQAQAEKDLGQQAIQSLNLPLESMQNTLQTAASTISSLQQNAAAFGLTMSQVSQIVQEEGQQLTSTIAQGMSQYVTNAADKQEIDQFSYQLQKAQWLEEIEMAEELHMITNNEYQGLMKIYNDLPAVADSATAAAAANSALSSSATNAADSLKAFAESLTQNSQLTALTPAQQLAQAQSYYQSTTAAAESGDQTALGNEQQAAQDYLTALRNMYGSAGPYESIFNQVLATLNQLGTEFGTGSAAASAAGAGAASGYVTAYGPNGQTRMVPPGETLGAGWSYTAPGAGSGSGTSSSTGGTAAGAPPAAGTPTSSTTAPDPATAASQAAAVAINGMATSAASAAAAMATFAVDLHAAHIPGFAAGGTVSGKTLAWVGEEGPEAIIPLAGGSIPVSFTGGVTSSAYMAGSSDEFIAALTSGFTGLQSALVAALTTGFSGLQATINSRLAQLSGQVSQLASQQASLQREARLTNRSQPMGGRKAA